MTAKEITLDYLKSIQKDLLNAINTSRKTGPAMNALKAEFITIASAIELVEEAEGE